MKTDWTDLLRLVGHYGSLGMFGYIGAAYFGVYGLIIVIGLWLVYTANA